MPGAPGDEAFEIAYDDALNGRASAKVVSHPNKALPRTLRAAWRLAPAIRNAPSRRAVRPSRCGL